jgi:WD40-like Beta Propeller Repeat
VRRHAKAPSSGSSRRGTTRGARLLLGFAAVLAAALVLPAAAPAATVQTHPYLGLFTPPATATPKGPFVPVAMAINRSTGNIYVVDAENDVIDIFKSNGSFLDLIDGADTPEGRFYFEGGQFSPIAIDNSGGENDGRIYVDNWAPPGQHGPQSPAQAIFGLSPSGSFLFWSRASDNGAGLAVDSHGSLLWASVTSEGRFGFQVFPDPETESSAINFPVETRSGVFEGIDMADISLDSQDRLYAVTYVPSSLAAVEGSGSLRWVARNDGLVSSVGVDQGADAIYATEVGDPGGSSVSRYDVDGGLQESFGLSIFPGNVSDVAVAENTGTVYVADASGAIRVFGPKSSATAPDATAGAATNLTDTTATLNGTVNPQGVPASWRFQYRRAKTRTWTLTQLEEGGSGNSDESVSAEVTGLKQNTPYEFRLQTANSENGAVNTSSNLTTFTTPGLPQAILTIDPPSSLTPISAHLSGTVDPNGSDAKWHFEYTTDDTFEDLWTKVGADQTLSAGSGATPVSADLTGLRPNTHYFARLIGTNETGGPKESAEIEFTTPPAPPVVLAIAAGCLKPTSACLAGYVDPKNSATSYHFEYGPDESYGSSLPAGDAGAGFGSAQVDGQLSGLEPDTTYHFRLVADNVAGTTYGKDMRFQTRPDAAQRAQLEEDWPARGPELVNSPDKGNQAVYPVSKEEPARSVSPDGNRILWLTANGGPDSTTGYTSTFLSTYTPSGWTSRGTLPPASQLPGGGEDWFVPIAFTPDFSSTFYYSGRAIGGIGSPVPRYLIGADEEEHVRLIASYPPEMLAGLSEFVQAGSGGRLVIGGGTGHPPFGAFPLTVYDAEGSPEEVPIPGCGYDHPITADASEGQIRTWANADATRIFIYSAGESNCAAPKGIYLADAAAGTVTLVSGAQTAPANFIRANQAGTEMLFSKGGDLYRWRGGDGDECLSCGSGLNIKEGTASSDLSHLYFCGPPPPSSPSPVDCAIYVWRESGIDFVANISEINLRGPSPMQMSEDGSQLIFKSTRPFMATADPTGWNGGNFEGGGARATQLYHYDDDTGIVECVSCADPPSGGLPKWELFFVNNAPAISADGQTIAFATDAKVLPEDINGRYDVYEWHNGLIRLVTDGESEFESGLGGIPRVWGLTPDGRSLIFSVGGVRLTGNELDTVSNVYDARVGSAGFPPQPPPAHCVEDSCQGSLTPAPGLAGTASSSFVGPGNETWAKKKAKRRRRHKRAHKHARHKQAAKANHKRGGGK